MKLSLLKFAYVLVLLLCCLNLASATEKAGQPFPIEKLKQLLPQTVTVKGGQLEYYRFGQGSPLVLISGYICDVTSWDREFLAALAAEHELIVFNNRDVGGSVVNSAAYDTQALAQDTYQLIQALGLKNPSVLGISMGGMIAQELAVQHPGKLGALILMNTLIAGKEAVLPSALTEKIMEEMPGNKLGRYLVAVNLFFTSSWVFKMGYALAFDRFQPQRYTEVKAAELRPKQRILVLKWLKDEEAAREIKQLSLPTLVLSGAADEVIPAENSRILVKAIPGAQLSSWQDGGHGMIYQYPKAIAAAINQFLSTQPAGILLDPRPKPAA